MSEIPKTAILLIGHGTRVPVGVADCNMFASGVAERLQRHVTDCASCAAEPAIRLAFLELALPTITGELIRIAETGVRQVLLAPLFLFAAGHIKHDIPALVEPILAERNLTVVLLQPFGNEPAFAQVVSNRIRKVSSQQPIDAVLLVGRGNKDAAAQTDFEALARGVHANVPELPLTIAYLAGTGRPWQQALDLLYAIGKRRILLQPYLWFRGWLTTHLPEWVEDWQRDHPDAIIHIGTHLGTEPLLLDTVTARIAEMLHYVEA